MAQFFEMPQASPTMEAGVLLSWKKKEGDALKPQDVIAEVETDKAAMDIEVFDAGFLLKILANEGDEIPAGQPIAIIGTRADEDISGLMAKLGGAKPAGKPAETPKPPEDAGATGDGGAAPEDEGESGASAAPATTTQGPRTDRQESPPKGPPKDAARSASGGVTRPTWHDKPLHPAIMEAPGTFVGDGAAKSEGRVLASPLARKIAAERGIALGEVQGSGPNGRVVRSDVENFEPKAAPSGGAAATGGSAKASVGGQASAGIGLSDVDVKHTNMRKTIAKRLSAVWHDAPVFYLNAVFDADALVTFREQLKASEVKVSVNDIVIKAVARALRDEPRVNAHWEQDKIVRHGNVHIGVAVALDEGLITPVVRHADLKSLTEIAGEVRELAGRARENKLKPEEYTGSTFSVSNLGMMGIEHFTAILNPPEAGILAVGGLSQEPVFVGGEVRAQWRMRVTMTCDHRVIDGALGAQFLQHLRRYIEQPLRLA